ncbi:MAG: hypothetical protein ACRC92_08710 [Peptostreptococcaceae bacterium]
MSDKKINSTKDNLEFLGHNDDQYGEILDSIEIDKSTDSETTNIINFRVINTKNPYPQKDYSKPKK